MKSDEVNRLLESSDSKAGKSSSRGEVEALCNAIIVRACEDYRLAIKKGRTDVKKEVLKFFHSAWFRMLTDVNADYIIKRLDEECRKEQEEGDANEEIH